LKREREQKILDSINSIQDSVIVENWLVPFLV
jgi:hypothetical protein